jgi:5-formyltetrahydrofolate cyclo-ligase
VPVATTVHDAQLVADFPIEANDLPLSLICTPTETIHIDSPLPAPQGIDWTRLDEADLERMPLLLDLKAELGQGKRGD